MSPTSSTSKKLNFDETEKRQLLSEIANLNSMQRSEFFSRFKLGKPLTNKNEFILELKSAIDSGNASYLALVQFLDEVMPWGKQHVFLFDGPEQSIASWKKPSSFKKILIEQGLESRLEKKLDVGLPDKIEISSISSSSKSIRITAVRGRVWWEREKNLDETKTAPTGAPVELRAFVQRGLRSLVVLDWDLQTNTAMLQISQLQSGTTYETVRSEFTELVSNLIPIEKFREVDLYKAMAKLHSLEEKAIQNKKVPVARSHALDYITPAGTIIQTRSAAGDISLLSEEFVDGALETIRKNSTGRTGNFFWVPTSRNPLDEEVRIVIVASKNRINFPTPNDEAIIRHVLQRIRSYC